VADRVASIHEGDSGGQVMRGGPTAYRERGRLSRALVGGHGALLR
jgi:hypothetical protein